MVLAQNSLNLTASRRMGARMRGTPPVRLLRAPGSGISCRVCPYRCATDQPACRSIAIDLTPADRKQVQGRVALARAFVRRSRQRDHPDTELSPSPRRTKARDPCAVRQCLSASHDDQGGTDGVTRPPAASETAGRCESARTWRHPLRISRDQLAIRRR